VTAPLDLDALDALTAAATDGPWTGANYRTALAGLATSTGNHAADAEFIRVARTALPRAVAELRALRPVVEAARRATETDDVDDWNKLVDAVEQYERESGDQS
jgi:hypothetical protein